MKKTNKTSVKKKAVKKKVGYNYQLYLADYSLLNFDTLSALRDHALKKQISFDGILVYRTNIYTHVESPVPKSKYAFLNKLYCPSKSLDDTGFYSEWSWQKVTPFQQGKVLPLPSGYVKPWNDEVTIDIVEPKTLWQKIKDGILNFIK